MRALRLHGNKDIRVDDVPIPPLRPGWVKIRNAFCGICGSDLHEYRVGPKNAPTKPHVLTGETIPTVLGHEFSGTIEELGEGVNDLKVGQKVVVFPILTCGACHWCEKESYGLCKSWGFLGYSGFGGGMADLEIGALVEPLAVGWHAVKYGRVGKGDHCLVIGAGPIGLAVVHALQAHGVESIVVSEPSLVRAAQAKASGATHVIDPRKEDVPEFCKKIMDGYGAHAVFECAGLQVAFDTAMVSVRGKGIVVNVAIYETTELVWKNPNALNRHQITIVGSNTYVKNDYEEVIDAIASGKIKNPENMITAKVPLDGAVEDGFQSLLESADKHVKILVQP